MSAKSRNHVCLAVQLFFSSCMFFLQELHLLCTNAHFFHNIDVILSLFSDLHINARFFILSTTEMAEWIERLPLKR